MEVSTEPKYSYSARMQIHRLCLRMENHMLDTRMKRFDKVLKSAVGEIDKDIWINHLVVILKGLMLDLKAHPEIRGGILGDFVCGDVHSIIARYKNIIIPENHFLLTVPGINVSTKGKLSCSNYEASGEQLKWLLIHINTQRLP